MKNKMYAVIMAGGGGTRFWPIGRKARPKQFLKVVGDDTLLGETIARILPIIPMEQIFIVTNVTQVHLVEEAVPEGFCKETILPEPAARNTAACIGYAAKEIMSRYGDGLMCVLASDHYIGAPEAFRATVFSALQTAEETDALVTIGIRPTFPSTGYGYIKYASAGDNSDYKVPHDVEQFVEKPDVETAKAYIESGDFAWNSGMFFWRVGAVMEQYKALLPDITKLLDEIYDAKDRKEALFRIYPTIPSISVDYGIMERAKNVKMHTGDFKWDDVGSFTAYADLNEQDGDGNTVVGKACLLDSKNNICVGNEERLLALIGVENLTVVDGGNALLVCPTERLQEIRAMVDKLSKEGFEEYV
ncbi:MAG: mannose-1-phosphate guanylyltransferase [Lachnospiraceae bacterium]|nr:mannose-1-phosphate guanylyltransferase [Lachnospiraceae bacterium]